MSACEPTNRRDTIALIQRYKETGEISYRDAAIKNNMRLAEGIALRYIGKGVEYEDLVQVASLALIGAIERFDPEKGFQFSTFAAPTIIGEIKNYFRDKTRMLHISRKDSEQLIAYNEAYEALEKKGRVKVSDVAEELRVSSERVLELMEMKRSMSVSSLERLIGEEEGEGMLRDVLGHEDGAFEDIEKNDVIEKALEVLDETEKHILQERFWRRHAQSKIAKDMGVSQMYISRAQRRILSKLKKAIEAMEKSE